MCTLQKNCVWNLCNNNWENNLYITRAELVFVPNFFIILLIFKILWTWELSWYNTVAFAHWVLGLVLWALASVFSSLFWYACNDIMLTWNILKWEISAPINGLLYCIYCFLHIVRILIPYTSYSKKKQRKQAGISIHSND